ncbi:EamA family transporter [Pantoea sp. FN060301]|uniref:EamA family transporter n=1 Tax=Pantoea sp. FN060301 TaxID=3420380 RepID=UPI003D1789E7
MNKFTLSIVLSVLMQSFAYGFITKRMGSDSILIFVMVAFITCSLFYFLLSRLRKITPSKAQIPCLISLNISTALAFLSFYISITLIPASVATLLEAAAGPLWVIIIGAAFARKKVHLTSVVTSLVVMTCGIVSVCIISEENFSFQTGAGIFLAVAAALGAALVAWSSKSAESLDISPIIVLAWRFHLTWILSFIIYLVTPAEKVTSGDVLNSLWLVFIGVVMPMYFMQIGMQKSSPLVTMMCLSMLPLITYIFEVSLGSNVNVYLLMAFSVGIGASFFQVWSDNFLRRKRA